MDLPWTSFRNDLRYALRQLRNAPGFTLTAVLTLALGLGVTVTVFSVVRQVLLAPLPYPEPQRLVGVAFTWPSEGTNAGETGESADFLLRNSRSFSAATVIDQGSSVANLSDKGGHASSIHLLGVSRGYFDTLGVGPAMGRGFSADEDRHAGPHALVLSYGLWQRAFGGDRAILGRAVRLNQESYTVVGVMPASFHAEANLTETTLGAPDAWRPLQLSTTDPGYGGHNYEMYARLRPGVSLAEAEGEMQALDAALYREFPKYKTWQNEANQLPHLRVWPLATVIAGDVHASLLVMAWASGAVLLLASLNLAGLNTARALRRAPEFALRTALGASRARLLRLALLEVAVLAVAGIVGAVLTARLLLPFLLGASPVAIPQLSGTGGVGATLAQAAVLGALSALLFGAPLAVLAVAQGRASLQPSGRQSSGTRGQGHAGRTLLVLQMSLAVVLLSTASLLLGTFLKLRAQPLGFQPQKLVVFQTNLKGELYAPTLATEQFIDKVLAGLRASPGVSGAAAINGLPLDNGLNDGGYPDARTQMQQTIEFRAITPGYFHTMGQSLLAGRDFTASDGPTTLPAVVISASTARRWWPDRSPIGHSVHMGKDVFRVVGIVADAPGRSLVNGPSIFVYAPIAQLSDATTKMLNGWFATSFVVRLGARIDAAPVVARAVAAADPEVPVAKLTTMQQVVDNSIAAPRFFTELAEGFAAFGVLLTAIGLFGLLSYQVAQRTREIGIRMALGASRGVILRGVVARSMGLAVAGALLGGAGALLLRPVLTHWVATSVVGVDPAEHRLLFNGVAAILLAILFLIATTLAAALLPARKASRVEPMEALRSE